MALRRPRAGAAALSPRERTLHAGPTARGRRPRSDGGLRFGRSGEVRAPRWSEAREHRSPCLERQLRYHQPRRRDGRRERRARLARRRRARGQVDAGDGHGGARWDHDRHRVVPVPEHRRARSGSRGPVAGGGRRSAGDHLQHLPQQALRGSEALGFRVLAPGA